MPTEMELLEDVQKLSESTQDNPENIFWGVLALLVFRWIKDFLAQKTDPKLALPDPVDLSDVTSRLGRIEGRLDRVDGTAARLEAMHQDSDSKFSTVNVLKNQAQKIIPLLGEIKGIVEDLKEKP